MAIIDADGLFGGKRLRRCSPGARLTWPHLYVLSNGYGRIEFDFDAIAFKFASFGDAAPSGSGIGAFFDEYEFQHLIYPYEGDGQKWGQWDTRRTYLKKFKTVADRQSPSPPEPMYSRWLREQHRDDWRAYHWNEAAQRGGEDQDQVLLTQGFPKSLERVNQDLLKSAPTVAQDFGLGVGDGVGVGNGTGIGGGDGNSPSMPEPQVCQMHEMPESATAPELVIGVLEILGIPNNDTIFQAVTESIRLKAASSGSSATDAAQAILLKAVLAKKENPPESWLFWFRDARYDHRGKQQAADDWLKRQSEDAR
jgi:hypothetical protein